MRPEIRAAIAARLLVWREALANWSDIDTEDEALSLEIAKCEVAIEELSWVLEFVF